MQQLVYVRDLAQVRTYRKKRYYFIKLSPKQGEDIDLKFSSQSLCKEWMGYLMQAMSFSKYLDQRQLYSRN